MSETKQPIKWRCEVYIGGELTASTDHPYFDAPANSAKGMEFCWNVYYENKGISKDRYEIKIIPIYD